MFRKLIALILLVATVAPMIGCGASKASGDDKKKIDEMQDKGVNPNPAGAKGVEPP